MKKIIIIMVFISLFAANKTFTQTVISANGGTATAAGTQVSWTIGEPVVATVSDSKNTLTQGFQQSNLTVSEIKNSNLENVNIKLYPNPTTDLVILETNKITDLDFKIYSTNGKLLKTEKINNTETQIFFTEYSSGIYFLTISNTKKQIKTFQIIKK